MRVLVKEIKIKTLISGDKQAQIIFETLYPKDIKEVAKLAEEMEIEIDFKK